MDEMKMKLRAKMMKQMMGKKPSLEVSVSEDEMDPMDEMEEFMGKKKKKEPKGYMQMMVTVEEKKMLEKMRSEKLSGGLDDEMSEDDSESEEMYS